MANDVYEVLGFHWGTFVPDDGKSNEVREYASLFAKQAFPVPFEGSDYHTTGEKCFVFKCTDYGVVSGIKPGDKVFLYSDPKSKKVNLIRVVESAP